MSWRKWIVRGLVFSIVGACACAAYLYRHWTNPTVVRELVVAKLATSLPGAIITIDNARLSLLGGIVVNDLRLARRDDPDQIDFLHVPTATIYLDKENLLDGKCSIRKVEMEHVRLRAVREGDGRWNLAGVLQLLDPSIPLPTVVIREGTFVLDDRLGGSSQPSVEINHVNLTFLNDPVAIVKIEGKARSELLGDLEIHGTRDRRTNDMLLSTQVQGTAVTPSLLKRLALYCPAGTLNGLRLDGQVDAKAEIAYTSGPEARLGYDVRCRITRGILKHPKIPLALEDLDATLRCTNGRLQVENVTARADAAQLRGRGTASLPCPDGNFEAVLEVKHLQLRPELFQNLPKQFQKLETLFQPNGPATVRVAWAKRGGRWTTLASGEDSIVALEPEDIKATFHKFRYPLEGVRGSLKLQMASERTEVDVIAYAGSRPVIIKGSWQGKDDHVDAAFDIQVSDVPLDEKLLCALDDTHFGKLARSFRATGKGDIKTLIRHVPGMPAHAFANEYHVRFHDTEINWEQFPFPLGAVSGILDIYPHHLEFYDFHGTHGGGIVQVQGRTTADPDPDGKKPRLIIDINGKNVALDDDLKKAMDSHPMLITTWQTLAPSGHVNFTAAIDRLKGPAPEPEILKDMSVRVETRGATIEPHFFPYALHDLRAKFHYHQSKVELEQFLAHHEATRVQLGSATIKILEKGGVYAQLKQFRAWDLKADDDFLNALPPALKDTCKKLELKDPIVLQTDLIVATPPEPGSPADVWWDGQVWLKKATLSAGLPLRDVTGNVACRGHQWRDRRGPFLQVAGNFKLDQVELVRQPFHEVVGSFHVDEKAPEVLNVSLKAPLFGGDIAGQIHLVMNSAIHYDVNLTASQIDLQEFGRHNLGSASQLRGLAQARLSLSGQGSGLDSLDGHGSLDVPRGHIYKLPLLDDLVKILGLRTPDRTTFDEAKAEFDIHGRRVRMKQMALLGNAISLYGDGDFKLDGDSVSDIKLDFHPSWGRVEQLVPEAFRGIPAQIGKKMLKIEMRGKIGPNTNDLKFTKKPLPFVIDPVLLMRDKIAGNK